MPRRYPPKQIWRCPVCDYELHSPLRITGATCKDRHPDKRGKRCITELALVVEAYKEDATT